METKLQHLVITGGTGFLGEALIRYYRPLCERITIISRRKRPNVGQLHYASWSDDLRPVLDGADLLINLAGKSVNCRYNARNKQLITKSRVQTTRQLTEAIAACDQPPPVWLNSSSTTYYRHAMDRPQTEADGEAGTGFSVGVVEAWEQELFRLELPKTRRVAMRIAIVLASPSKYQNNHLLKPLKRLALFGLGGKQGPGDQMFSWLHADDFARATEFLYQSELDGAVNLAAPEPVTNTELMRQLRQKWGPGVGLPAPARLLEVGATMIGTETELILKSRWVLPERLQQAGFEFSHPTLKQALKAC